MIRYLVAVLIIALFAMQGCGQTGDLYWPEDEQVEVDEEENKDDEQGT
ncbi:MAG: lipoprotein [Gammaproteobacteria bacterium]|nr:lipoprotein [Gammaproteobacteria bacterium]